LPVLFTNLLPTIYALSSTGIDPTALYENNSG
jgi:hypothetical protein